VTSLTTLRLFLHVLSASIWVGGQIVLAGLVPTARELSPDGPLKAARAFNRLAWPAYGVAVVTGIWNLLAVPLAALPHPLIEIKILVVALSGIGALLHQYAKRLGPALHLGDKATTALLAVGGAMSSVFAVAAMWVGVAIFPEAG
jgi:hypothetical protein